MAAARDATNRIEANIIYIVDGFRKITAI